jgi:hypothetical protein
MAYLIMELDTIEEVDAFAEKLVSGLFVMGLKYADQNGNYTFEGFFKAMKDNKDMNKLILKVSDV